MDWRAALRDRLISDAALAALVGTRVYIGERPQGSALPALVLLIVSDERPATLKAWDYPGGRVQFDAYADDNKEAFDVGEAALSAVSPPASHQGHVFAHAEISLGLRDASERVGGEAVFRVSFDVLIFHNPA